MQYWTLYNHSVQIFRILLVAHRPFAACNQEGCSHHCGGQLPACWTKGQLHWKADIGSLKLLEKKLVIFRNGQHRNLTNRRHGQCQQNLTPRVFITMVENPSSSWQASSNSQSPTSNLWPRDWNKGQQLKTSRTRPYHDLPCSGCMLFLLWAGCSLKLTEQTKCTSNTNTGWIQPMDTWWYFADLW